MADYEAAAPMQFPSAEAVGMKRAREDGIEGAVPTGQPQQQQAGGPWPGYPGENVYRLVVPVNRVRLEYGFLLLMGACLKDVLFEKYSCIDQCADCLLVLHFNMREHYHLHQ